MPVSGLGIGGVGFEHPLPPPTSTGSAGTPTVTAPFIGSVTVVNAPTLSSSSVLPAFIASATVVYAPSLPRIDVPFIASVTAVYTPSTGQRLPAAAWVDRAPAGLPSIRERVGVCYFPPLGKTVFFGGWDGTTYFADTYTYDASTNTFATLSTTHSPSARWASGQMAYDAHRDVIVLFGGLAGGSRVGDTWEFDGTDWTQITTTHSPSARDFAAMAFDQANNQIVLYSGSTASAFPDETWTYDGTDWTQHSPTHTPGTLNSNGGHGRYEHSMAWDPVSGSVLMVGGYINGVSGTTDSHVYHWDGTDWTSSTPAHPIALAAAAMTNNGSNVVVWSDGFTESGDAFQWAGTDWLTYYNDGGNPFVRTGFDLAYDPTAASAGAIIAAFGRRVDGGGARLSDLQLLLNPAPRQSGKHTLYVPTSRHSTEANGGTELVNAFNVSDLDAEIGPFFGLPADGMYAMSISPDGVFGIVTEVQVNTSSAAAKCWVFPISNPGNFTQITLSSAQARGVSIMPGAGGHWYALVCGVGTWQPSGVSAAGTVDVVDMSAGVPSIIKTISSAGVYPTFIAITSDNATAIVMDSGTTGFYIAIYTIDLTGPTSGWSLAAGPSLAGGVYNANDLLLSPDDSFAWIADGLSPGKVRPLDLSSMTFSTPITSTDYPGALAITPDGTKLWVGVFDSNTLNRIDTGSKTVDHTTTFTGTAGAGGSSYPITLTPDGTTLYWSEGGPPGHLWAMDTTALTPVDTGLQIPGYGSYIASPLSITAGFPVQDFIASKTVVHAPTLVPVGFAAPFIASATVVYTPTVVSLGFVAPFISSTTVVYTPEIRPHQTFVPFIASVTIVYTPSLQYTYVEPPFISSTTVVYQPTLKVSFTGAGVSQVVFEVLTAGAEPNANVTQVTLEILVPWYDGLHVWERTGGT